MKKIGINGFGRIGRLALRNLIDNPSTEIVAINDLADTKTLAHLLKYDSAQGKFPGTVETKGENIVVNGKEIKVLTERNPEQLPWKELGVDLVIECTGIFRSKETASMHLTAGAKKVVLSAPAKGSGIDTVVLGVNDSILENNATIISNASCTTNCSAPMIKLMHEAFNIENGFLATIHAYTADQRLQDAPHSDLRRARAAATSIIPTSTGAAAAVGIVYPAMKGKLEGVAYRVPVPTGSLTELTLNLTKDCTVDQINDLMKQASQGDFKGLIEYTEDPIVSADIVGNSASCIFDAGLTKVNSKTAQICGWYDNEMGYASRVAQLVKQII